MATRQIASSTLWQIASQGAMAALSIVTVKFVAIGLSKELAGNYNSAYGFLQLFGILADFGLYAVAVREVSGAKHKEEVLGALVILRLLTLLFSLGVALLFAWLLPLWQGTPLPIAVSVASLVPFFTLLAGIVRTVFQVTYKMHYVFIAEVVHRIVSVSLIGGTVLLLHTRASDDLMMMYAFLAFGGTGSFVLFVLSWIFALRLMRVSLRWNGKLLRKIAKAAAPYGLAFLCVALYRQLDVTLIALLRPDYELQNAYYGFVQRMTDMGFIIPTFLLNSTLPSLSERHVKGEDTKTMLGKTFLIILLLGSTSLLFAILWSRPLVELLTTEGYLSTNLQPGSDTALEMMAAPMLLNGIILFSFYVLLTKHVWKRLVFTLLCGVVISISLNLFFIPSYGFVGAALTSIIVHIILAAALFLQSLSVMPMHFPRSFMIRWLLYSAGLGCGLWLFKPFLVHEVATVIGLAAGGALIAVMGLLCGFHRVFGVLGRNTKI